MEVLISKSEKAKVDTHPSGQSSTNCYCSYIHQWFPDDGQRTLLGPILPLCPCVTTRSPVSHLQPVWHPPQNLDCTLENIAEYEWQDATCPPPLLFH